MRRGLYTTVRTFVLVCSSCAVVLESRRAFRAAYINRKCCYTEFGSDIDSIFDHRHRRLYQLQIKSDEKSVEK